MPKVDPFTQRRLLDLAAIDRQLTAAAHRRTTLPELAEIAAVEAGLPGLREALIQADTEVGDLDRAERKLTAEIDAVRARAERDAQRLASGATATKDLENLQHEIESLHRRQGVLEDETLDLMDRRETADAVAAQARQAVAAAETSLGDLATKRDASFAEVDAEVTALRQQREQVLSGVPTDLVALYEKIRARGGTAAGELTGARCGACRMELERAELDRLRAQGPDEVCRCTECGAILIRFSPNH